MGRRNGQKAGAAAAASRKHKPHRASRLAIYLAVFVAFAAGMYVARRPILSAAGAALVASDPLEKADVAVVLGGEETREGERTRAAITLYRDGWVRKLVLSGPQWSFGLHETDFSVPLAISAGIPRGDIIPIAHSARSTKQEAELIVPQLKRMGFRSFYVVSSNYHTGRARRIFREVAAQDGSGFRVLVFPAPDDWYSPDHWWQSREGRKTFVLETLKTFNSLLE